MGEDNRTDLDLAWEQWIHVLAELRDLIDVYHGEIFTERQIVDLLKQGLFWAKIVHEERTK